MASRIGADPVGRGAALARGAVLGASPKSWSGPLDEEWTEEAQELQERLESERPSLTQSPSTGIDEVALLHAMSPGYASSRHEAKSPLDPFAVDAWREVNSWRDGVPEAPLAAAPSTSPPLEPANITEVLPPPPKPARPSPGPPAQARTEIKPSKPSQPTLDAAAAFATAADRALAQAPGACKLAIFVPRESLAAVLFSDAVLAHGQLACGAEAKLKLSGKPPKRVHIAVHAVDEPALDRALIAVLRLMSLKAEQLEIEVRWLLRNPTVSPESILERWQAATAASQATFPIQQLGVELPADCIKLTLTSDGWEDWEQTVAARAAGAAAPLVVAWLLAHVRYGGRVPALRFATLAAAQESLLQDNPATLRALCAQSNGALAFVLRAGPWLLLIGPRTALRRASALLLQWEDQQEKDDGDASEGF